MDWNPRFGTDYQGDIRNFSAKDMPWKPDVVCASPDCTDFARWRMRGLSPALRERFLRGELKPPDVDLIRQTMRVIGEAKPDAWILENVHGSKPFIEPIAGPVRNRLGPYYLYGDYPSFTVNDPKMLFGKSRIGSGPDQAAQRAEIPRSVAEGFLNAIERGLR